MKEEMFVGADDFFEVGLRDVFFRRRFFLGDAFAQDFRSRLQINHQVGRLQRSGERREIALVEFQFLIVQIDVRENLVFLE